MAAISGEYQPKKRKSNFDVAPDEISTPNLLTTFLNQSSANSDITALKDMEMLRSQFNTTYADSGGIFGVVTDEQFVVRLEKALEKNFEYILRY